MGLRILAELLKLDKVEKVFREKLAYKLVDIMRYKLGRKIDLAEVLDFIIEGTDLKVNFWTCTVEPKKSSAE